LSGVSGLILFLTGQTIWLPIITVPLLAFAAYDATAIVTVISLAKGIFAVLKSISGYLFGFLLFIITTGIGSIIYLVIFTDFIQNVQDSSPSI